MIVDGVRVHHVRGEEEAERFDDALRGGITELLPVSVEIDGGEGAARVLREDPRLAPVDQLPLGFQDVGHEVSGEEERVLLGCGACMISHHDVVIVAVERCWLWVEVAFGSVGRRAGVGVVGGVTEPSAGGASHGLPKVIRPVTPGAGALAGALGDVTRRPYGWCAAREPHPECRAAHEL